jgi:hypothetical protein
MHDTPHRSPENPESAPAQDDRQVPGYDERDSRRGHRSNSDVEGGADGARTTPVDAE